MHDLEHEARPENVRSGPAEQTTPTELERRRPWLYVGIGATLLFLLLAILAGLLNSQSRALRQVQSAPIKQHATQATPTFDATTQSLDYDVNLNKMGDVMYAGADIYAYALRASDGRQLWRFKLDGQMGEAPVVANDLVYVNANWGQYAKVNHIYALHANDGSLAWRYDSDSYTPPPTIVNGIAYLATHKGLVAALDARTGRELWHANFHAQGYSEGMLQIVDGVLYVDISEQNAYGSNNPTSTLYALRASDGKQLWSHKAKSSLYIALIEHDMLYVDTSNGLLALSTENGRPRWQIPLDGSFTGPQLVLHNNVLYALETKVTLEGTPISSQGALLQSGLAGLLLSHIQPLQPQRPLKTGLSTLYALRADDGSVLWRHPLPAEHGSNWARDLHWGQDMLYFSSFVDENKGYVYALHANDGSLAWRYTSHRPFSSSILAQGKLYLSANTDQDTTVMALAARDGKLLWSHKLESTASYTDPLYDGTSLYVGTHTGEIYALRLSDGSQIWKVNKL
ncbi:hypothetical protein EPA93_34050 [Ktedonosporobacter rubrisoli]|uniref:Pyrrolo-quinoline quinone repeat domain-containing protein n=1 Tax=Ktedonosporobacter rubrisoli TaxID=2509675 RepID=A0A4P6JYT4_KTERU|nr:PQQ-binding-like beta-propeller repeat protein [Ktedonosporobacter rubrisoli]QBD80725.1 hypothetical protein EPA93_34050 [Ktedonosporobacter rubrisoli]